MYSAATARFVARLARAGSVMESITISAGTATDTSIAVNSVELMSNSKTTPARTLERAPQRAFAACVKEPNPCVQALIDANGALKFDNELTNWGLVEKLMSDKYSREVALGIHDDARMAADYELVREFIGLDKPFDVKTTYTNEFLDRSVKMTK